jgi:hypothetical protein
LLLLSPRSRLRLRNRARVRVLLLLPPLLLPPLLQRLLLLSALAKVDEAAAVAARVRRAVANPVPRNVAPVAHVVRRRLATRHHRSTGTAAGLWAVNLPVPRPGLGLVGGEGWQCEVAGRGSHVATSPRGSHGLRRRHRRTLYRYSLTFLRAKVGPRVAVRVRQHHVQPVIVLDGIVLHHEYVVGTQSPRTTRLRSQVRDQPRCICRVRVHDGIGCGDPTERGEGNADPHGVPHPGGLALALRGQTTPRRERLVSLRC